MKSVLRHGSFGLLALSFASALVACSDEAQDSTAGKRIALDTRIEAGLEATQPFSNSMGWSIALSKIAISTAAFYYFEGATIFSHNGAPPRSTPEWLFDRLFSVRTAMAHPGHYVAGTARGQMLTPTSADLKKGVATLGSGEGVTGLVRSATFSFATPAQGPLAQELGSHVLVVEGVATKGADSRAFRAEVDAADVLGTQNVPSVEGCPFTEVTMEKDGVVTVSVKLPLWFDQADFASVPVSADGTPVLLTNQMEARRALTRGMKAGEAYVFSYATK